MCRSVVQSCGLRYLLSVYLAKFWESRVMFESADCGGVVYGQRQVTLYFGNIFCMSRTWQCVCRCSANRKEGVLQMCSVFLVSPCLSRGNSKDKRLKQLLAVAYLKKENFTLQM
ncbi:hypothetical protein BaRGS_00002410 [Batillaria attramentaria]|uniref:Uncharacterized protein n=1 Tax=Batillaria attramentaria TaxID=370345 RepID=A0ABD0M4U0_9CAEN